MRILILFIASLVACTPVVFAQKENYPKPTTRDTAVIKLFDKPAEVKWVKYFKGRMDDAALVDVALGFDGRNCRGYLTYVRSKVRFQLAGNLDSAGFRLQERLLAGSSPTGMLQGKFKNKHLEAEWTNYDNTLGSRLEADEMGPGQTLNLTCGDNKWANRYVGRYNAAGIELMLSRVNNGDLYGMLWVESDGKTYDVQGSIDVNGNYALEAVLGERVVAQLQGILKPQMPTDCNWVGSGEKRTFKFTPKDNFIMGCFEYGDYLAQYDALYPRTACPACNTWLDQQAANWMARCKTMLATKKDLLMPSTRSLYRASCWSEITCWTDNIFAGYLTFSDTWSDQAQGTSYNFDLKSGKNIAYEDLFTKGFNARAWLSEYGRKEMPKMPQFASDPMYREWLTKEGFPQFTLRREGLEISTLFHPRYGRQALLVPYSLLKPYMKKDNPIAAFVK